MTAHHCKTGYHDEPAPGCYSNHGCRCDGCRSAGTRAAAAGRRMRARRLARGEVEVPHGTPSTYRNYSCRCERCTTAVRKAWERAGQT